MLPSVCRESCQGPVIDPSCTGVRVTNRLLPWFRALFVLNFVTSVGGRVLGSFAAGRKASTITLDRDHSNESSWKQQIPNVTCVFQPVPCRLMRLLTSSTYFVTGQGTETCYLQMWTKFGSRRLAQDRKRLDRGKLKGSQLVVTTITTTTFDSDLSTTQT